MARVVLARAPLAELDYGVFVDCGRERDDRPDIEVDVRPSVEPPADPGNQRIIDRRVAERAGDPEPPEMAVVDGSSQADNGVQAKQRHGDSRVGEIDLLRHQRLDESVGQRLQVDLEAHLQCERRADDPGNDLVHAQHVGPELLVAEGVIAEDPAAGGSLASDRRSLHRCR
jgi:hypothetical protein